MQSPTEKGNLKITYKKKENDGFGHHFLSFIQLFNNYAIFSIRDQAIISKLPLQVIDRFSQWVNNLSKQKLIVFILVMTNSTVTEINIRIRKIAYF